MIPDWLKPILVFFGGLAWVGLALSILSHLAALLGSQGPLGDYAWLFHVGIFVVWLATVLVATRMSADFKRNDFWKAALRVSTVDEVFDVRFLRICILELRYLLITAPKGGSGLTTPTVVRGFSGHWMAFYSSGSGRALFRDPRSRPKQTPQM